jgi:diacylglycerol O-acyltransferase / wax synthase
MLAGELGVRPVDRLTDEDQRILWPDEIWPQDIGALAVLDGSSLVGPDGRLRIEAVREVIAARLHLVPRFRQRLYVPRPGLGRPLWVDAPAFDLADHVRVLPVPDPGDEAALLRAAERLRRLHLDRSRPLWQLWFLSGLPEGQVGMFVKIHHVIGDATAAMATVGALLDAAPDAAAGSAQLWTPAPPPPAARDLLADNLRHHATGLGRAASALARPVTTARHVRAAWTAVREAAGPPGRERRRPPQRGTACRSSERRIRCSAISDENFPLATRTPGGADPGQLSSLGAGPPAPQRRPADALGR